MDDQHAVDAHEDATDDLQAASYAGSAGGDGAVSPYLGALEVIPGLLEAMSPTDIADRLYGYAKEIHAQSHDGNSNQYRRTPLQAMQLSAEMFATAFDYVTVMSVMGAASAKLGGAHKNLFLLACDAAMLSSSTDQA